MSVNIACPSIEFCNYLQVSLKTRDSHKRGLSFEERHEAVQSSFQATPNVMQFNMVAASEFSVDSQDRAYYSLAFYVKDSSQLVCTLRAVRLMAHFRQLNTVFLVQYLTIQTQVEVLYSFRRLLRVEKMLPVRLEDILNFTLC